MNGFRTSDTQLASFLLCIDHTLVGIEGPRGRRTFVFEGAAEKDKLAYFQGTRQVDPRKLWDSYRRLKNLMFETQ